MPEEKKIIYFNVMQYGNSIINGVSIIAAAFVVAIIVSAMLIDRKTMNRVSIRITLAISILDILRSVFHIVTYDIGLEGAAYIGQEFVYNFITLAYFFLNISIAVNLQLIFLNGYSFNPFWERAYWAMSFGMAFLISLLVPVMSLVEDVDSWEEGDRVLKHIWEWSFMYFWILLAIVYCTVVVSLVIVKLIRNEQNLSDACEKGIVKASSWQSTRYNTIIKSLIYRISFYCAIPVVTHTFFVVEEIDSATHDSPMLLLMTLRVLTGGLPGILNFFAFLADPAYRQAIEAFKVYQETLPFSWPLELSEPPIRNIPEDEQTTIQPITSDQSFAKHESVTLDHLIPNPSLHSASTMDQQFEDYIKSL